MRNKDQSNRIREQWIIFVDFFRMAASKPYNWTESQRSVIQAHLDNPIPRVKEERNWQPKYPLNPPPADTGEEQWSASEFKERGFPSHDIPDEISHPLNIQAWDELIEEGVKANRISPGQALELDTIKDWFIQGVPDILRGPALVETISENKLEPGEVKIALDTIADYVHNKHVAGPFDEYQFRKIISIFGR